MSHRTLALALSLLCVAGCEKTVQDTRRVVSIQEKHRNAYTSMIIVDKVVVPVFHPSQTWWILWDNNRHRCTVCTKPEINTMESCKWSIDSIPTEKN
jgi:hypothetical protein